MISFCYSNDGRSPKRWFLTLTRLSAREDFCIFIRHESFKSYAMNLGFCKYREIGYTSLCNTFLTIKTI
jgi:hypothetical protein